MPALAECAANSIVGFAVCAGGIVVNVVVATAPYVFGIGAVERSARAVSVLIVVRVAAHIVVVASAGVVQKIDHSVIETVGCVEGPEAAGKSLIVVAEVAAWLAEIEHFEAVIES